MHGTAWSALPFLIVIPIALLTRQVLMGLMVGLIVGSYMLHPSLIGGLSGTLDYLLKELALSDNVRLIVFLYGFGSFVGLVRVTGGVTGFAKWMERRIRNARSAFVVTWLSSFVTFMAPDFRIITIAPLMKQLFNRFKVPSMKVAFTIDVTSTPFTAVVPLGTVFVGYMVGLIGTSARHYGVSGSAYHLFLLSIPLNFFSFVILAFGMYQTFASKKIATADSKTERKLSRGTFAGRLRTTSRLSTVELGSELTTPLPRIEQEFLPDPLEVITSEAKPRMFNLIAPLAFLLGSTFFLTWWDGHLRASSFWGALAQADASRAMVEALLATLVLGFIWYLVGRQPVSRIMSGFLIGGNEMMNVILLLVLVWSVSAVSTDLGFSTYTERTIAHLVPRAFIAPVLFLFGCAISYVIGSSFGTWGMLLPLGFSLAAATHASPGLIAGAVFASGTFGGFASPLSDNTVAMATVMKLPLLDYARYKLKPALWAAAVSTVLYGVAGLI